MIDFDALKAAILFFEGALYGLETNRQLLKDSFSDTTYEELEITERHIRVATGCMWAHLERLEAERNC